MQTISGLRMADLRKSSSVPCAGWDIPRSGWSRIKHISQVGTNREKHFSAKTSWCCVYAAGRLVLEPHLTGSHGSQTNGYRLDKFAGQRSRWPYCKVAEGESIASPGGVTTTLSIHRRVIVPPHLSAATSCFGLRCVAKSFVRREKCCITFK